MSDAFRVSLTAQTSREMAQPFVTSDNCTSSETIDFTTIEVDYLSLQYSMMIAILMGVLGAFAFFATAWYLVEDKAKVDRAVTGQSLLLKLTDMSNSIIFLH